MIADESLSLFYIELICLLLGELFNKRAEKVSFDISSSALKSDWEGKQPNML